MTTTIGNQTSAAPFPRVLPMRDVAKSILDDALARAKQQLSVPERSASLEKLFRLPVFQSSVKYAMAQGVARVLSENDKFVRAIYVYEPSMNSDIESGEDLPPAATVHLLVLVVKPSAALQALIDSLDRALTSSLHDLPSNQFKRLGSVLDVNLVTEQEVQLGTGYAVLLSSLFAPPIKLWPRQS
jgi:hypothetical protein